MYQVINKESGLVVILENKDYFQNKGSYTTDLSWKKPKRRKKTVVKKVDKE